MLDATIELVLKPVVQTTNAVVGISGTIGGMVGVINPWVSLIILTVSGVTVLMGFYFKWKIGRNEAELSRLKLDRYKKIHNRRK